LLQGGPVDRIAAIIDRDNNHPYHQIVFKSASSPCLLGASQSRLGRKGLHQAAEHPKLPFEPSAARALCIGGQPKPFPVREVDLVNHHMTDSPYCLGLLGNRRQERQ
jgi:hypothetical protein